MCLACSGVWDVLDGRRFVFVDECSTNTSLSPIYGWPRRGLRVYFEAPRNGGANVTLLSSISLEGMGASLAVEGASTKALFETYIERVLAPELKPGQIVVMDNLSSHKGSRLRQMIEGRGCKLLSLPPYSPDLNPIEEAFSKVKAILRKAQARSYEALIDAMSTALSAISSRDARGFFEHRAYHPLAQLL